MSHGVRVKGERVRGFVLQSLTQGRVDVVGHTRDKFKITRQAVLKHMDRLRQQNAIQVSGTRRKPIYTLVPLEKQTFVFNLFAGVQEHEVWEDTMKPLLQTLPNNVVGIWSHGFTEMLNNCIDHSGGKTVTVDITKTAQSCQIDISDDGVGIFKKIQTELDLQDERHAIFELAKGKLTTDPRNHSGEGIFFTSRMLDKFLIWSGGLFFSHQHEHINDYLLDDVGSKSGTMVRMALNNHSSRTTKKVFDQFSSKDGDYTFNKTVIPIALAEYGGDGLISRSQAKRVLARVELFEKVMFDFKGVESIGQAFADQIFRVYALEHPGIELTPVHMSAEVEQMVARAKSAHSEPNALAAAIGKMSKLGTEAE